MKRIFALALLFCAAPLYAATDYPLTEDSKPHDNVPKGEVFSFVFDKSKIFPGTRRNVSVYVPKQYDGTKPACVYVNQDGVQWNAPTVFDNLIAKNEMPVTIGVFVTPGVVPALSNNALSRYNRSLEYDGLGPDYANFVINELLPEVETKKTADGRAIVLSKSGNDRAIGGSSSGAICAFTAAWERPDAFSRVFSAIGTYVGLRGGNEYPTIIRKIEPKPIRVFLQDGSADQNIYGGDWWIANQAMQRSLAFAGYEVNHAWGDGGHNGQHGSAVFPDAMRYLWKDWPQPIKTGLGAPQMKEILIPGEDWKLVGETIGSKARLGVEVKGGVFVTNYGESLRGNSMTVKDWDSVQQKFITSPNVPKQLRNWSHVFTIGPNSEFIGVEKGTIATAFSNEKKTWCKGMEPSDLVATNSGALYALNPAPMRDNQAGIFFGQQLPYDIVLCLGDGAKKIVAEQAFNSASKFALSADQTLLYVSNGKWVHSYHIQPDGTLAHGQKYYHLHIPDNHEDADVKGMCVDRDGRLYVATNMGIQVCDQAGRVNSIIPMPNNEAATSVVLGGADFDTLFASAGGKIYKRKVKTKGAPSFLPPVKPAPPRL